MLESDSNSRRAPRKAQPALSMKTVQFLSRIHEAAGNHSSASAASDVYQQRLAEYAEDSTSLLAPLPKL